MLHFRKAVPLGVLIIVGLISLSPSQTEAVTLDKTSYVINEPILVTGITAGENLNIFMAVFNLASGDDIVSEEGINNIGDPLSVATGWNGISGNYSVLEMSMGNDTGLQCSQFVNPVTYENCKAYATNEFLFTITTPPSGGGGEPAVTSTVVPYPSASISAPKEGDVFSYTGIINYNTLNALKVNLYYSDTTTAWNGSLIELSDKVLVASDISNNGPYSWGIKGLTPTGLYRIVIDALGVNGFLGQAVSGLFSLDFIAPTFIVKTDPTTTRGKDVLISVDASENLKDVPTVTVTQAGGSSVALSMKGQGSHYEGIYIVQKGYDGVASVTVSGSDKAGNVGTSILSGGTFAVGINPPSPPRISTPQNNTVVGTSTITIAGFLAQREIAAMLLVNGVDTYVASSSQDGTFMISNVRLSKDINHGLNVLSVAARDFTGLLSPAVPLQIKYNIAPTAEIFSPVDKTIVSAITPIMIHAKDENADPLLFMYQIIPAQNFDATVSATSTKNEWHTIGDALPSSNFSWDSTEVESGQYLLRVIVDDGLAKTYSLPISFFVRNTLPFFRFEDGRKTITNLPSATIVGRAIIPSILSSLSTVKTVEYSLDAGKKWKSVQFTSGRDTSEARFSVAFTDLVEGTHGILWRIIDSRGLVGRANHPVIVDTIAPSAPIVNIPTNNAFVTNEDDMNVSQNGLQINISGTTEPQNTVTLQTASTTVLVSAGVDGGFVFRSVTVPKRGESQFVITATDAAGNKSKETVIRVVYDNPPIVSILTPKSFRGLTEKAVVSWSVTDADNDRLQPVLLSYRRGEGVFLPLKIDTTKNTFEFDVSNLPEANEYQLRVAVSDGMATGTDIVDFSVDRTPPILSSFTLLKSILREKNVLRARGTAYDTLSGIEYVEYAVAEDKPTSFFTALLTRGFLQNDAAFTINYPEKIPDSTYTVYARAVDAAGNVSPMLSHTITVDSMPPSIGSFDVLANSVRVVPNNQGNIVLYKGMKALFEISLEGDTDTASITLGTTTTPLKKDISSGLWQATLDIGQQETMILAVSAKDAVGNAYSKKIIGSFSTIDYGRVVVRKNESVQPLEGVTIKVLVFDESTDTFVPFRAHTSMSDAEGKYILVLPPGDYKLSAHKNGYRTVNENKTFEHSGFVNVSFTTEKLSGVWGFVQNVWSRIFSQ